MEELSATYAKEAEKAASAYMAEAKSKGYPYFIEADKIRGNPLFLYCKPGLRSMEKRAQEPQQDQKISRSRSS